MHQQRAGRLLGRLTPSPCAQTYGNSCGTTFLATGLFDAPGANRLEISDPALLQFGVLLVGVQRLNVPLPWNCDLHTDFFAAVPLVMDPVLGNTSFVVVFPPGTWTMQAGTFGGTTIHMSSGIEFICP